MSNPLSNPQMLEVPSVNGLWSSITGNPGVRIGDVPLPVPLQSALAGALNVDDPQQGVAGATPSDTRTKTQRAADDAAGKVYNSADGTYSDPGMSTGGSGSWTNSMPSWLQSLLFTDWLTGKDGRTETTGSGIKGLLLLLVIMALGGGLIYFGIKNLAE